jgi:hypothetical protein
MTTDAFSRRPVMKIAALTPPALVVLLFAACGGRIEGSGGMSELGMPEPGTPKPGMPKPGMPGLGMPGVEKPNGVAPDPTSMGLDQSRSYCLIDVAESCPCPSGSVCVSGATASGTALLGCVPLDVACHGTPSCDCMYCVCDGLGQSCGGTTIDDTSDAGLVLHCM